MFHKYWVSVQKVTSERSISIHTYIFLQENSEQHVKNFGTQDEIVGYEFDTITTEKSLFQTYKALLYVRKFRFIIEAFQDN
jgi:hypothetical protein